jgi:hypothetical protein
MNANRALMTVAAIVLTLNLQAVAAENTTFALLRSTSAVNANCIPNAKGRITINSLGSVEVMHVEISGLPPNKEFDVFVIQLPNAPFGLSWYQGDIETSSTGVGVGDFIGRFSIETFIVAPGTGPAPVVHTQAPFPDANSNPATGPVHTFHVGVWFGSPTDAQAAGCPNTITPFNGDHHAGIQALSTRGFANLNGPLKKIQ